MINFYLNSYHRSFLLLPILLLWLHTPKATAQNTHLIINTGSDFVVANNDFVLNNTDIAANGILNASNGNLIFTGSSNTTFGSTATPAIKILTVNKPGNATIILDHDISVTDTVDFQQGFISLNTHNLLLGNTGYLKDESNPTNATGLNGGSVTASAGSVTNPSALDIGNLGAAITSTKTLGNTQVTRTNEPVAGITGSQAGIQRNYLIQPANNTNLNATLRLYYFDAELNGNYKSSLSLWSSADGITWTNAGVSTSDTINDYVEETELPSLHYFTLADANNALPVTLMNFSVTCEGKYALVEWKTAAEINVSHFEIQKSTDGNNWSTIQSVAATDNISGADYSYQDTNPQPAAFYRLKTFDLDGTYSYSPIFSGGCADIAMPFTVYPNPANNQATASISVRQAASATLQLYSMDGKQLFISKWNLQPGINQLILPMQSLSAGTYIIKLRFYNTVLTTQLIKQP